MPKGNAAWDSCYSKLVAMGRSNNAAEAITNFVEQKGVNESFVVRPEDFELDTSAREELTEADTAYLIFDNDTIVEVKKSVLPQFMKAPAKNEAPQEEDAESPEEDDNEEEEEGIPDNKPFKKKFTKEAFSLIQTNLVESAKGFELVDVYPEYAVVTSDKGTGDYKLYRAPYTVSDDKVLFESEQAWEEIEISYLPDSTPLAEPVENEVDYKGDDVVSAFTQSGFDLTDVYPGYVEALKEGQKYRFDFINDSGTIHFSPDPILVVEPKITYTGEQVVESFKEAELPGELTDIFAGYIVVKDEEGFRFRYNFVESKGRVIFDATQIPVQPVLNTVRVLEVEEPVLKESVQKTRTLYLSEGLNLQESFVDRKQGIIDVTLIKPGWSLNGRYYSPKVLQQSLKVWDGIKAYGNHPTVTESKELPERSIWDQVGYYTNPRWEDGKVKATLKLVGDDERKSHILDWAEESSKTGLPLMGLSINALGKTTMGTMEGRKGIIVEDIAAGSSVDVVTTPSAGGSFDKLLASDDGFTNLLLQNLEYDEWREARPDFFKRLQKEMKVARKEELENTALRESEDLRVQLKGKEGELKEAFEQVNRAKSQLTKLQEELENVRLGILVDQKLVESKLPNDWVSSLRPKLLEAGQEKVDAMITEEKKKFFGMKSQVQVKNAGPKTIEEKGYNPVAESLGVAILPLPFERPEDYQKRKEQISGKSRGSE